MSVVYFLSLPSLIDQTNGNESDIWDDTALIKAYDKAINSVKVSSSFWGCVGDVFIFRSYYILERLTLVTCDFNESVYTPLRSGVVRFQSYSSLPVPKHWMGRPDQPTVYPTIICVMRKSSPENANHYLLIIYWTADLILVITVKHVFIISLLLSTVHHLLLA